MISLKNNKGIMSLAVIFVVGLFGLGTALTIATIALVGLNKNYNTNSGNKSFYAAETAAQEGAYRYINDPSSYPDGVYSSPLINNVTLGTFTVANLTWPYVEIKGTAGNNLTQREVVYTLTKFTEGMAFYYAIYSNNNLEFGGNANIDGNIFANTEIDFHGNALVNGDAFSPETIEDVDNILGDIFSDLDPIPPPEINLQPYYDAAEANFTLFATATDAETYLNNQTREGVVFVEQTVGKTKIQGTNTNLTGSLVVLNSLDLTGGTYTATSNYAALVVQGDLKIAGGAVIYGIVYVKGSTSFGAGGGRIEGSLISAGAINDTELTGNADIIFDPTITGNWQNLIGLSTTTMAAPRIIGWNEQ